MPFEYFVRPFEGRDVHGRIVIPSAPGGADQRATLTWGNKTSLDSVGKKGISVTTHWPDFSEGCCKEEFQEKGRSTTQVKITDKTEPENWILVNRATELSLDKDHKDACNTMDAWYAAQMQHTSTAPGRVLRLDSSLTANIAPRSTEPEKCKSTMKLNANTAGS